MINEITKKIIKNEDFDNNLIRECFDEIFSGLTNDIIASSFITLLKTEELNVNIISSIIQSAKSSIKKINLDKKNDLIETIDFYEKNNFLNISFCVSLICSCAQLGSVKYHFDNDTQEYIDKFERINFCDFPIDINSPYYKYTNDLYKNLPFENILSYANKFLNPYDAKNCFVLTDKRNIVEKLANVCLKLNYDNSIIVSGDYNLPFVTPEGESFVAEAWKNKIFAYKLSPNLLEFSNYSINSIKCENREQQKEIIKAVFENKIKNAPYTTIVINSALALYISKKANSLLEGIDLAKKIIEEGKALLKFEQIKYFLL